jgi:hypothetical protein
VRKLLTLMYGLCHVEDPHQLWLCKQTPPLHCFSRPPLQLTTGAHTHPLAPGALLLLAVCAQVPEQQWGSTPLTLLATAGVRMLNASSAQAILAAVDQVRGEGVQGGGSCGCIAGVSPVIADCATVNTPLPHRFFSN